MTVLNHLSHWLADRVSDPARGFGPAAADERAVFGARRPGFPFPVVPPASVDRWIRYMQAQQISRVVCLLPQRQLGGYSQLLEAYRHSFGISNICWSPIEDFTLADATALTRVILPFLADTTQHQRGVVVHCSGGIGRTGHVIAAWLVSFRGMSNEQAIKAVRQTGRNPRESRDPGLDALLDQCRRAFAA